MQFEWNIGGNDDALSIELLKGKLIFRDGGVLSSKKLKSKRIMKKMTLG